MWSISIPLILKNNKAVGQAMPAASFSREVIERMNSLRYFGIDFYRMLMYKTQVESRKLGCKKGLSAQEAMAAKGIKQHHLPLLCQNVILSIIDSGLGLTTLPQSILLKLDRVENGSHESHSGNNKTHTHWGHVLPAGPAVHGNKTQGGASQSLFKAYLSAIQKP